MLFDDSFPIQYIDPVYRPPSEARSLILPVTNGCSWNKCSFCEMYTDEDKQFFARKESDVLSEIESAGLRLQGVRRVFLADGDAMVLSVRRLTSILQALNKAFPGLNRVSSYCLPRNIAKKSIDELKALKRLGLSMLYVGVESGDDEVLTRINKGETAESTFDAVNKIQQAGIKTSVMVLNGLGGQALSEQHALNSARLINRLQPDYLSTLVLTFHKGPARFENDFGDDFQVLNTQGLFNEMLTFVGALELEKTIYRSDHISNRLALKGVLGKDKESLLKEIELAIEHQSSFSDIRLQQI